MSGTAQKSSKFAEALGELLKSKQGVCPICESPERANIEAAKLAGVSNGDIGKTLRIIGVFPEQGTSEQATRKVRSHFETHPPAKS